MKSRVFIIAILALTLTAATTVPRVSADPLTVMAVIGVLTVLSVSSVDMIAHSDEDNKDMRAQQEEAGRLHLRADTSGEASAAGGGTVATP